MRSRFDYRGTKIYRTNKLFALSKYQPVAIMLYGSADFLDVPWETIIKSYRARLGQLTLPTVGDRGRDLLNFIEGDSPFFSAGARNTLVTGGSEHGCLESLTKPAPRRRSVPLFAELREQIHRSAAPSL